MADSKTPRAEPLSRPRATRLRVLDAAGRLLRGGGAAFSMRELAAEAGVSFATPFNLFGSKAGIMHALSADRIDAMTGRYAEERPGGDAADRVLAAVDIAAAVMLADPEVNRAVVGILGSPGGEPGDAMARSRALWALAVGDGDGLAPDLVDRARSTLPGQLAFGFRGVLSFWSAGEVGDDAFARHAREAALASLLGFVAAPRRGAVLAGLDAI